jgi:hypothetical protein
MFLTFVGLMHLPRVGPTFLPAFPAGLKIFPPLTSYNYNLKLVGAGGFEPPASCSQSRRAARLRYAPIFLPIRAKSSWSETKISRNAVRARARWLMRFFTSGPSWAMVAPYSATQKTGS